MTRGRLANLVLTAFGVLLLVFGLLSFYTPQLLTQYIVDYTVDYTGSTISALFYGLFISAAGLTSMIIGAVFIAVGAVQLILQ